ncbi:hypothetical protein [Streptomyces endophyticus]|uniref:Uncharacterized protein n=1 Tax=Streptomyces endophyticus TaxID=714166 RepID=A0ABU6F5S4_9ACTN|nr:hypothetical protein [Streptomyces endophyticus]MEB8339318.1 hypothetical protein [Streptomyces endophyticus]
MISELMADSAAPPAPRLRSWVAPLISSLITLPAAFFAHRFAAEAARFGSGAERAFTVFGWGLTVALLTLATAWLLPWEERFVARRRGFSVAAPFAVVATFALYLVLVDWP